MLERARPYFENVLSKSFNGFQEHTGILDLDRSRNLKKNLRNLSSTLKSDEVIPSIDERIMTRKTRTRRPRIPALQSGYCAVCNLPYNSVEDHIQSKKHQKLIGEDANYIALNGSLNGFLQSDSIPFLNLNGVDAIGVHESPFEEFSSKCKKRTMPRTRARSVLNDRVKPSPLSAPESDTAGHHLRSRRNINYMTLPSDDDSLEENPDLSLSSVEHAHPEYKEYRELRSSTRAIAKLAEDNLQEEVWNSGRPKRACIGKKRLSIDDTPNTNSKSYYKVEVVTPKRSTGIIKDREVTKRQPIRSPKRDDEKEKALIVKFKKLRNSELTQLNNEATNFLFPKKDDDISSEECDEIDNDDGNTVTSSIENSENVSVTCSDNDDSTIASQKIKEEDDQSMDSTCSSGRNKKKRRTHAEAFIMDNQKYYKFETPGSRLRYHGSYLPPVIKSPKRNGEILQTSKVLKTEEPEVKTIKYNEKAKVNLDNYKFSFEKVPINAPWYSTFQRLDKGEQRYKVFSDYFWDPFVLPYQMPSIPALDPRICIQHYKQILKCICDPPSEEATTENATPDHTTASSPLPTCEPEFDEDSKLSATTASSSSSIAEDEVVQTTEMKTRSSGLQADTTRRATSGRKPRKSPRQHASTLAILSSLIQNRRSRTKDGGMEESVPHLPDIPEEAATSELPEEEQPGPENANPVSPKLKTPRKCKPRIDYFAIARQIDEELDTALDDDLEQYELEISEENTVDFHNCRTSVSDIMTMYEEGKSKETENSCRRFFNGTPGRKPGRRKKMNKTGWPNKNKKQSRRGQSKEKENSNNNEIDDTEIDVNNEDNDNDGSVDSESGNNDSEEEMCDEEPPTDDIKNSDSTETDQVTCVNNCDVDRVEQSDKLVVKKLNSSLEFQPYVCVQKLDSKNIRAKIISKQRNRRRRHIPGSPKSPRMLRKPRGRWYRER